MEVENKGMNISEAKKPFMWNKEYSGQYILEILEELEKSVRETIIELEEAHASAPQEYWEEYDSRIKQLKEVLGEDKK